MDGPGRNNHEPGSGPGADGVNLDAPGAPNQPADSITRQLDMLRQEVRKAADAMATMERRGQAERAVAAASPVDHGLAAKLVEEAMTRTPGATAESVVASLKRDRPAMFRPRSAGDAHSRQVSAMSPMDEPSAGSLESLRQRAMRGDRQALARYLRLRRGE